MASMYTYMHSTIYTKVSDHDLFCGNNHKHTMYCPHACTYIHTYMNICQHTYIHTYMKVRIYEHMPTYIQTHNRPSSTATHSSYASDDDKGSPFKRQRRTPASRKGEPRAKYASEHDLVCMDTPQARNEAEERLLRCARVYACVSVPVFLNMCMCLALCNV